MLVRHYIHQRLSEYYSQPATSVVGSILNNNNHNLKSTNIHLASLSSSLSSFMYQCFNRYFPQMTSQLAHKTSKDHTNTNNWLTKLWGEIHWKYQYYILYHYRNKGQWLTPVELFQPYYSNCIANYISLTYQNEVALSTINKKKKNQNKNQTMNNSNNNNKSIDVCDNNNDNNMMPYIDIIELGGGHGTNCEVILNHLYNHHRNIYNMIYSYNIIDSSKTLHEYQKQRLLLSSSESNFNHQSIIQLKLLDIIDIAEGRKSIFSNGEDDSLNPNNAMNTKTVGLHNEKGGRINQQHRQTYVIALEILDNLPHDKIRIITPTSNATTTTTTVTTLSSSTTMTGHNSNNNQNIFYEQAELIPLSHQLDDTTIINDNKLDPSTTTNTTTVNDDNTTLYRETFQPLSDELIKLIVNISPSYFSSSHHQMMGNISSISSSQHSQQLQQKQQEQDKDLASSSSGITTTTTSSSSTSITSTPIWIPTITCGLIYQIYKERPNSTHILFADFDWLPLPDLLVPSSSTKSNTNNQPQQQNNNIRLSIPAINEPLITCMNKNDYECYINSPKYCDILYPTDFYQLSKFITQCYAYIQREISLSRSPPPPQQPDKLSSSISCSSTSASTTTTRQRGHNENQAIHNDNDSNNTIQVVVQKQSEFLQQYSYQNEINNTKSWLTGYSPLIHDFSNCSILTASSSSSSSSYASTTTERTKSY